MKINFMPAFKYRFMETLRSTGTFFAVMVLVVVIFTLYFTGTAGHGETTLSAFGSASSFATFIIGICTVREQLRLCLQLGVSRKTAFLSEAVSALLLSLLLAAGGELLMALAQSIAAPNGNVHIFDLYQILYVGLEAKTMSFSQHMGSLVFNASLFIAGYAAGGFISLVFYRLSKPWKVVVAVGVPVLLLIVFPTAVDQSGAGDAFSAAVINVMNWMGASVVNWVTVFLGAALVTAALNWLLMRRAPVIPAAA